MANCDQPLDLTVKKERDDVGARGPNTTAAPSPAAVAAAVRSERHVTDSCWSGFDPSNIVVAGGHCELRRSADGRDVLSRSSSGAVASVVAAGGALSPRIAAAAANRRLDSDRWRAPASSSSVARPFNSIVPANCSPSAGAVVSASLVARSAGYEHLYNVQQHHQHQREQHQHQREQHHQQQLLYASCIVPQPSGATLARDRSARSMQQEVAAVAAAAAAASGVPSAPHETVARSRSADARAPPPQQPPESGLRMYRQVSPGCRPSLSPHSAAGAAAPSSTPTAAMTAASREPPLLLHDVLLAAREKSIYKQTAGEPAFMLSPAASFRNGAGAASSSRQPSPVSSHVGFPAPMPPPQSPGGRMQPSLSRRSSSPLAWDDAAAAAAAALQLRPGRLAAAASALERPSATTAGSISEVGASGVNEGLAQDLSRGGAARHTSARRPGDGAASEASAARPQTTATSPTKPGRLAAAGSASSASVPTSTVPGHLDADYSRLDALSKFHMQQQQQLLMQLQQQHYARSVRTASTHSRPVAGDGRDSSLDGRSDGDYRRGRLAIGVGKSLSAARASVQDEVATAALYDRGPSAVDARGSLVSASTLLPSPHFVTFMPKYVTSVDDCASARLPSTGPARSVAATPSETTAAAAVRTASLSPDGSGRHGRGPHVLGPPLVTSAATRAGSMPVASSSAAHSCSSVGRPGGAASQSQHGLPLAFNPTAGATGDAVFEAQLLARHYVPATALNDDLLVSTNVNAQSGGREQLSHRGRGSSMVDLRALAAADVKAHVPAAGDFGSLSYRDAGDIGSDGYSGGSGPSAMVAGHAVPASGLLSSGTPMKRHRGQQQPQQHLAVSSLSTSATDRVSTACVSSSSSSSGHYTVPRVSWSAEQQQQQQQRELCYGPLLGSSVGCTWQPALLLPPPIVRLPSGPHDYYVASVRAAPVPPPPWPSASRQPPVSPQQLQPRHQASCPSFASATAETGGSVAPPLPSASPPSGEPICLVKNYASGRDTSPQPQQRRAAASSYGGSGAAPPSPAHGHVQLAASASSGHCSPAASAAGGTLPGTAEGAAPEAADRLPSRHSAATAGPLAVASGFPQPLTAGNLRPAALLREPYDIDEAAAAGAGHCKRIPASTGLPASADAMPPTASRRSAGSPSHLPSSQSTQFPSRTSFLSLAAVAAANSGSAFGGVAITCAPALAASGAAATGSAAGGSNAAAKGGAAPVTTAAATVVVDAYSASGYRSGPSSLPGVAASVQAVSRVVSKIIPVANVQPFFKNALTEGCASVSTAPLSAEAPTTPHKPLHLPPAEKHRPAKDAVLPAGGGTLPEFPVPAGAPKVAEQPRSVSSCGASATGGLAEAASAWSPPVSKSMPHHQERECAAAAVSAAAAAAATSVAAVAQHCTQVGISELPLDDIPSAAQRASPPPMKAISALDGKAAGGERRDVSWSRVDASASSGPGAVVCRTDDDPTAAQSPLASSSSGGSGSNLFKRLSQHRKDYSLHPKKRPYVMAECESLGCGISGGVGDSNGVLVAAGASAPATPSSSCRGRRCSQLPSSIGSASMPLQLCSSKRKRRSLLDEIANTEGYVAECDRLPDKRRKLRLTTRQSFTVAGSLAAGVFKIKQKRRQTLKVKARGSDDAATSVGAPADGGSSMLRAWSAKATRRAAADHRRRVSREAQASGVACDPKRPRVSKRGVAAAAARAAAAAASPSASRSPSPPLAVIAGRGKLSHSVDGDDEEEEEEEEGGAAMAFNEESGTSCSSSKTMALAASVAMRGRKRRGAPPRGLRSKERSKRFRTTQSTIESVRSGANSVRGALSRSSSGRARYVPLSRPFARLGSSLAAAAAAAAGCSRPSRPAPVAAAVASATCDEPPGSLPAATYHRSEGFSSRAAVKPPQPAAVDEVAFELCSFYLPVYTRDVVAAVGLAEFVLLQDVLQNSRCLLSRDRMSAACGAPSAMPLASLRALAGRTVANAELAQRDDLADPVEIMPYSRNLRRILGIKTEVMRVNPEVGTHPVTAAAEAAADTDCKSVVCLAVGSAADSEAHPLEKKLPVAGPTATAAAVMAAASDQTPTSGSRSSSAGDQLSRGRMPTTAAANAAVRQQAALPQVSTSHPSEADGNSLAAPAASGTAAVSIAPCRLADSGKKNGSLQAAQASSAPVGVAKCSSEHTAPAAAITVAGRPTSSSSISASQSVAVSLPPPLLPVADTVSSTAPLSAERSRPPLILRLPLPSSTSFSSSSSVPQAPTVGATPACLPASSLPRPASTQPTVTLQRLSRELLVSCGGGGGPSDIAPLVTAAVAVGGCAVTEGVACGESTEPTASSLPIDRAAAAAYRTASTAATGSAAVAQLSSETVEAGAEGGKQHNRRSSLTLSLPLSLPLTYRQHKPQLPAIAFAADAAIPDDDARPPEKPVAAIAAADAAAMLPATDIGGVATVPPAWPPQMVQQRQLRASDTQQHVAASVAAGVSSVTDASADADTSNSQCCPFIQHFEEDAAAAASANPGYGCRTAAAPSDSSTATAAAASPLLTPLPPLPVALPPGATAAEECTMPTLTPVYADDRGAGNCMSFA